MSHQEVIYGVADGVAPITLNRPDKLNAWTFTMEREVREAFEDAAGAEAVRVIVLRGAGRAFSAGADLSVLDALMKDPALIARPSQGTHPIPSGLGLPTNEKFCGRYNYMASITKPVIAAIHGPCIGVALAVSLFCDVRIASTEARFGLPFSRLGLIAEHGVSWMLPRLIGLPRALEMLFSSETLTADKAAAIGLVNQVVPAEAFEDAVQSYVRRLADQASPRSLGIIKWQLYRDLDTRLNEAIEVADQEMERSFTTEDFREGVAHFLEKRPPRFTGR